ncbi:hypothetical protein SAMN04487895_10135 [Paenibacillus sophorae]|uniref:Uncharacterized protein n=1 Tax=Paenibacillus sophorae TaxID=1333845 RepID=A0A1H8FAN9_9BACL|nr:hypothetical protein SAMN04487895_10135 [Paenibacillus sophorae]
MHQRLAWMSKTALHHVDTMGIWGIWTDWTLFWVNLLNSLQKAYP